MAKPLIIVESPAKTKTLKNFLGGEYEVEASMGHVRDLPKWGMGVDIKHNFKPKYTDIPEREKVLANLKKLASKTKNVYLATDPDREGEAIAWHLEQALDVPNAKRIEFNEITKSAVQGALEHPRTVDEHLVDAQQARRVLDRLVGYTLSPLLSSKIMSKLSAGRVQSVALRLIVDREREIEAFKPEEYWSIAARLSKLAEKKTFLAKLVKKDGKNIKLGVEGDAKQVLSDLEGASYVITEITRKEQRRHPSAPFITSTLQQEASRKLGFSNKKTMSVAQSLYEGVELGSAGSVGLITYMRTDSTRIAGEAIAEARKFILSEYGKEYVPDAPRQYKSRKSSQDAHEAIRPSSVFRKPESIEGFLSRDQLRLYRLIWQRFVACQMESAVLDLLTVDITARKYLFRVTASSVKFPGFTILYTEGHDNAQTEDEADQEQTLPKLEKGETLKLWELLPKQHFTEPPPRYTQATLVKALEENGIGRPSTYASIVSTIIDRRYVVLEKKVFKPTELGATVTDQLVKHFPEVMDTKFTAGMETKLDEVEEGAVDWVKVMSDFWGPFEKSLEEAKANMEKIKPEPVDSGQKCPNCGLPLLIRQSRYGEFLGCSGYPKCKTIVRIEKEGEGEAAKTTGVKCPMAECDGEIAERRSKRGKIFYSCNRYPKCTFALWDKPLNQLCPKCGSLMVEKKPFRGKPAGIACSSAECDYKEAAKPSAEQQAEQE
jgi:DNA topoisomerase-1